MLFKFFYPHSRAFFSLLSERGEGREKGREGEREASIVCPLKAPGPGIAHA